jgi:hypothetical protein
MHRKIQALSGAMLIALAIGGVSAASATAAKLTLYANGEPVPVGTPETAPFSLTSTAPFTIRVPSEGLTVTCTPKHHWMLRGWMLSNGKKTDRIKFNQEGELDEVRHCEGTDVAGPQIAGKLSLQAIGTGSLVPTPSLRPKFDMVVGAHVYDATSLAATATIGGPLDVSLSGTFTSEETGETAELEIGPFAATYESQLVEAIAE